jgi:DNA-binding transcriptional MerR regulator
MSGGGMFPWEEVEAEAEAEAEAFRGEASPDAAALEAEATVQPEPATEAAARTGTDAEAYGAAESAVEAEAEDVTARATEPEPQPEPQPQTAPPPRTPAAAPEGTRQRPLVRKEYYAISEVADLVGLPAHVLRYWESQFAVLNPSKNRSGNRVYQRKEIKLILLVKQLLHEEKYTVEGAKQKLEQLRRGGSISDASARALDAQMVGVLREELLALNELLGEDAS